MLGPVHSLLTMFAGALQCCSLLLQVDATFEGAETLQVIPRLVYALLRSPLLGPPQPAGRHPDTRTSLQMLWASLSPEDLQTAVYPRLSSYQDPHTQVRQWSVQHVKHTKERDLSSGCGAVMLQLCWSNLEACLTNLLSFRPLW